MFVSTDLPIQPQQAGSPAPKRPGTRRPPWAGLLIPLIASLYVGVVILLPALNVVVGAFAKGWGPSWPT